MLRNLSLLFDLSVEPGDALPVVAPEVLAGRTETVRLCSHECTASLLGRDEAFRLQKRKSAPNCRAATAESLSELVVRRELFARLKPTLHDGAPDLIDDVLVPELSRTSGGRSAAMQLSQFAVPSQAAETAVAQPSAMWSIRPRTNWRPYDQRGTKNGAGAPLTTTARGGRYGNELVGPIGGMPDQKPSSAASNCR